MSFPSESKNLSTLISSDKAETCYRDFLESSLSTKPKRKRKEQDCETKNSNYVIMKKKKHRRI